jgi:exocyst complex component 8
VLLHTCKAYRQPSALVNVFKIKHGKETHVYRTDSAMEKKNLLSQFRHVAEELAAKRRKEREGEHERRKSLWASGGVRRPLYSFI